MSFPPSTRDDIHQSAGTSKTQLRPPGRIWLSTFGIN